MRRLLLASLLWASTGIAVPGHASSAVPARDGPERLGGEVHAVARRALASHSPIGFLYINEGTGDRRTEGAGNVVSGFAAFAGGSLELLPGSPWPTGGASTTRRRPSECASR